MKITRPTVISRLLPRISAILTLIFLLCVQSATAEPAGDAKVYWDGGKRGHIDGCSRLPKDSAELAKMKTATYAEMKAGGALLCSKCPGSTTAGKGGAEKETSEPADDTKVYWDGGKRGHVDGCRRLPQDPAELAKMKTSTYGEMKKGGALLCSRCPGSTTAGKGNSGGGKKTSREKREPDVPAVEYDPNTKVYADALWLRVHAEDCPSLILKDEKKTMTLEEADKAGYRIGESGQSGRENCCLVGYRRKHPDRKLTDETILAGNDEQRNFKHIPGCHRYWPESSHRRRPLKDWVADGFKVCPHCIERGPATATVSDEEWAKLGSDQPFVAPEGWEPKPFPIDQLPPQKEVEILIRETLAKTNGIQELQFTDPVATAENFTNMRFFFPVGNWLHFYKAYRSTGDQRLLDKLLVSARHYNKLAREFPSVAQQKASDPEGMPFMYSMAATARITLQLARKGSDAVTKEDVAEAEEFLTTMLSVLKPTCEGDSGLDPEMGIPKALADDFRTRAFNRALNGIGTLGMMTAALEDLQVLKNTKEYQPRIDRYRKVIAEYIKHWKHMGDLSEYEGDQYFSYAYSAKSGSSMKGGVKLLQGPEDQGHYSHSLQGAYVLYESVPELGIDDAFMTAIANAVHFNSRTRSGSIQSPQAEAIRPYSRHPYGSARDRFYLLEAFKDGVIDGQSDKLNEDKKAAANSEYDKRLATLHAHYMKALRKDPGLVYLGEKKP